MAKKITKKSKKTTSKKRTSKKTSSIKKMVKREIAKNVENKTCQVLDMNESIRAVDSATFTSGIFAVSPMSTGLQVLQGVGNGSRIGNLIKIKRLTMKGTVWPRAYNATDNPYPQPIQIKMWLFYQRDEPTALPSPYTDFFQYNNTTSGFQNDLIDLWMPVNSEKYVVKYTKVFKLGFSNNAGSGSVAPQQYYANNDFKYNHNFSVDVTPYLVKNVKFNDNNSDPTTRALWCMFTPLNADGSVIVSTYIPAQYSVMLDMEYEDA